MNIEETKKEMRKVLDGTEIVLSNLYGRWMDEREYENIEDYAAPINKVLEPMGYKVEKMYKRPFGFTTQIGDYIIRYKMTSRNIKAEAVRKV